MLERMKALARQEDLCVLATASENHPHCSLMAYVADDNCREIYMVTYEDTNKYRNVMKNPSVSLLIDTREEHAGSRRPEAKAMTVTGIAQVIDNEEKKAQVREKLLKRHPHLKEFAESSDAAFLCVKVSSFLLLDGLTESHFEEV